LSAPYAAVSRFYDPSCNFVLQFTPTEAEVTAMPEPPAPPRGQDAPPDKADKPDDTPKVVSLDQFRKK
jgi:hypothetical protein